MDNYHIPVLVNEVIRSLQVENGKSYIDATLGGGGHTEAILKAGGCVLGIDVDQEAIDYAGKRLAPFLKQTCPERFIKKACPISPPPESGLQGGSNKFQCASLQYKLQLVKGNFSKIKEVAKAFNLYQLDGILFDLGVSTHQLETPNRGFSFNTSAILDMRMDQNLSVKALDLVNGLREDELYELFTKLGEEHRSRAIAHTIIGARKIKPITTCDELAAIALKITSRHRKYERTHPATRIFQALRIAVNDELNSLKEALPQAVEILNPGGRLVIISFHSLEDRLVKNFFKENENLKIITEHPLKPTNQEIISNPRSRSAKLRVAEKL